MVNFFRSKVNCRHLPQVLFDSLISPLCSFELISMPVRNLIGISLMWFLRAGNELNGVTSAARRPWHEADFNRLILVIFSADVHCDSAPIDC